MPLNFLLWLSGASLCAIVLVIASALDLRSREVPDRVWLIPAPAAILLTAAQIVLEPAMLVDVLISLAISALIGIAVYFTGLMGGADAKAIAFIAISVPIYWQKPMLAFYPFVPLASFCNAILMASLISIAMLARNVAWRLRTGESFFEGLEAGPLTKALALLVGYKVRVEELSKARFLFPMEDLIVEDGSLRRKLVLFVKVGREEEVVRRLLEAAGEGAVSGFIWVSPGIPLICFIALGYVLAILLGDILSFLIFAGLSTLL